MEAPEKIGQYGTAKEKVRALEALDKYLLKPLIDVLGTDVPYRIALCTDSLVESGSGRLVSTDLPFVLSGEGIDPDDQTHWNEVAGTDGALGRAKMTRIVRTLLRDD